jgi:hypothetical protein
MSFASVTGAQWIRDAYDVSREYRWDYLITGPVEAYRQVLTMRAHKDCAGVDSASHGVTSTLPTIYRSGSSTDTQSGTTGWRVDNVTITDVEGPNSRIDATWTKADTTWTTVT